LLWGNRVFNATAVAVAALHGGGASMPRKVKSRELDSREARSRLKPRGMPYYKALDKKLHLGYRRIKGKAGTWWARHYLGERQYAVEPIGTADDQSSADGVEILDFWQAQDKARERMAGRVHSNGKTTGPLTVKAALDQYLEWLESNRKSGYDARRRAEAFIYPKLGEIDCAALTADMLGKWHVGLAKALPRVRTAPGNAQQHREFNGDEEAIRRRRASANRVLTILKAALNRAWRAGKVPSDSEWRRVEPFEAVDAARIRYLTVAESKRLLNACDPDFRRLCQAALATGARYGELTELQVHDFNADAGTVAIRRSKSGKPRHIVLTEEGVALFKELSAGRSGHDLVLRRANGEPFHKSDQARPMIEGCDRAKIKPRISFHILRHTWASLAVMNGVPLMIVAKNLGHADTRMVEKHYGHLAPSYVAEAIRKGAPVFGFKVDNKIATLR
jgi:integrase